MKLLSDLSCTVQEVHNIAVHVLSVQEREREIHYVHWASKAYEDESVFMSEAHLGWQ